MNLARELKIKMWNVKVTLIQTLADAHGTVSKSLGKKSEKIILARLFALHVALIPFENVIIQLFSLQLLVKSRTDWLFSLSRTTGQGEGKL